MKAILFSVLMLLCGVLQAQTDTLVVHFDFDKYELTRESSYVLKEYFVPDHQKNIRRIELYGHCDYIGNHTYNDALSKKRVQEIRNYLTRVLQTVDDSLITDAQGFGKRRPLNDNSTAEQRLQNRRVEIIVHLNDSTTPPKENKTPTLTEIIKDTARRGNIILRNLNFQGGRHYLLPQSQPILDELYRVMADNPTLEIQIEGHVCCTPDNADGLDIDLQTYDLSVQRAKAIYGYLVQRGIAPERLSYTGFGGSRKLYRYENDEFERQENRRVELKIIKR